MLEIAYMHKDALQVEYAKAIMKPENFYYNSGSYHSYELEVKKDSWNDIQYVSVTRSDDGGIRIDGYLCANICRQSSRVTGVQAIQFNNSFGFSYDLLKFLESLFLEYNFRKIEWYVTVGNPAEKMYDKIAKIYGGRIIGTFREAVMLPDGDYYDHKYYEIFRQDYMKWKCTRNGGKNVNETIAM